METRFKELHITFSTEKVNVTYYDTRTITNNEGEELYKCRYQIFSNTYSKDPVRDLEIFLSKSRSSFEKPQCCR